MNLPLHRLTSVACRATLVNVQDDAENTGEFIRRKVLPAGMSVKEAAKKLGVGRAALSNLLNGKAGLSPEMALRLEKAFGADRQKLIDLQTRAGLRRRQQAEKAVAVSTHVPSFLKIKARQIEAWAESHLEARAALPVLLRRLVHSTGRELRHVDFPGYDNAQRRGPDGCVEAGAATPWIPEGVSFWEFGTDRNPAAKANDDYAARTRFVPRAERAHSTFVFVTPRNWPGKTRWVAARRAGLDWKEVRALDASDLEQWLETSISGQIWLAERLAIPTDGFETLDQCWIRWASASEPPMTAELFEPSVTTHTSTLKDWLQKRSDRPFVVAADSSDEALAFLACLFRHEDIDAQVKDLAAVFHTPRALKTLASSSSPFIPIVTDEEAERELATLYRRLHCIVVRPRNAVDSEPDITLDLLTCEAFEKAVASMGVDREAAERLARESGRSPTILRRRLSRIDGIRTPGWARDSETAVALIPLALVGAWHTKSRADCEVLSALSERPYAQIEEAIARLLQFDDPPVWSAGQYRGVASKVDVLFAINRFITAKQLSDFLLLAEYVLAESDPALDLPEDQRWAAGIYGKVRDHSAPLRRGVCETLVILSVQGNDLFRERLGFDAKTQVALVMRRLLSPLTLEKLMSHDSDLPRYAEAAPDEFLTLVENDLRKAEPVVLGLLKPASSGVFGRCVRTGLLWALECLAWSPQRLGRVSAVLARLSETEIDDNWANKPIASLQAIYRAWIPQTAASVDDRIEGLEMLTRQFPDIGWRICLQQFSPAAGFSFYSYRPQWRSDASGASRPVSDRERFAFARKALDLAIAWPHHDQNTLGDLVECLGGMPEEDQATVWDLIDAWSAVADDKHKATLRERIRRFVLNRRGRQHLKESARDRARDAYATLMPQDPVIRHGWLFATQWVDESANESEDDPLDYSACQDRIHQLRLGAMEEIWTARGLTGASALLEDSKAPVAVGYYAGLCASGQDEAVDVLRTSVGNEPGHTEQTDGFLSGFIQSIGASGRRAVLQRVAGGLSGEQIARLYRCAPFDAQTWRLLDQQPQEARDRYWGEVVPQWGGLTEAEVTEVVDRLLDARRPRAAFLAAQMDWDKLETSRLKRLLMSVVTSNAEPAGSYQLSAHGISDALEQLDRRAGVTQQEKAQLEFLFLRALDHTEHGISNLERQVAESPSLFVQAVALAFKRTGEGEDPPEWRIENPEQRATAALAAHRLLERIRRIPGTRSDGSIDAEALGQWLTEARRLCAERGRADIGDQCIGGFLSRAPEKEGLWPCRPVAEAMEAVASVQIGRGFHVGARNARGAHWRRAGGEQEREEAAKYRKWVQQLAIDYPFVSSVVERIASSYEHDAEYEDSRAAVDKRLAH